MLSSGSNSIRAEAMFMTASDFSHLLNRQRGLLAVAQSGNLTGAARRRNDDALNAIACAIDFVVGARIDIAHLYETEVSNAAG